MPLSEASLMTASRALRSDGLITITLTPAEIRLRISEIWPLGSVVRLAVTTLETTPEALAWALMEQIISSRNPFPVSVLEMPTTYFLVPPPLPLEPPQAATSKPAARINPMAFGHLPADISQPPASFKPNESHARWVESDSLGKRWISTHWGNRLPPTARDRKGRVIRCQTTRFSGNSQLSRRSSSRGSHPGRPQPMASTHRPGPLAWLVSSSLTPANLPRASFSICAPESEFSPEPIASTDRSFRSPPGVAFGGRGVPPGRTCVLPRALNAYLS